MLNKKIVGVPPHIRTAFTMESTMYDVMIALIPVIIMATVIYGFRVILLILLGVLSALLAEYISSKILNLENQTFDGSAVVTGTAFVLTLPVTIPFKVVIFGSVVSIVVGKTLFGGIGKNIFNPALVGRLFVMLSYPQYVYNYSQVDGNAGASIFPLVKYLGKDAVYGMFGGESNFYSGIIYGSNQIIRSMGEVSLIAIILGFVYLKTKRHIKLKVPAIILLSLAVMYMLNGEPPFLYILSGGVCFASVYMATDMVTSPYTNLGLVFYSLMIGVLTYFFRTHTSQPEGVTYAILIANICVPTLNKYTLPRSFGGKYNMKKMLIFLTAIILIFLLSYGVFEIDKLIEDYKVQKETEMQKESLNFLFEGKVETGDGSNAVLSDEGYYFEPLNKNGELIGHFVIFESKGYSETLIKIIMGINLDGTIKGLKILEQNETLGLGSQIQSKEWESLWRGRDLTYKFNKTTDAYAGATYTFLNVYKKIMEVLESYEFAFMDDDFDFEEENIEENIEEKNTEKNTGDV